LPTVRGELLAKLGGFDEARPEFERAAALTCEEATGI
jgi:predicted RNA polymerase sigma factor